MTDHGLREALRELARERDAVGGHVGADYTIGPSELLDLLKAHPAAPVDREELDRVEAAAYEAGWNDARLQKPCTDESDFKRLGEVAARRIRDRRMAGALEKLADDWRQSADEDERYLNRANASEIHDVYASIRINREHADAVLALLDGRDS